MSRAGKLWSLKQDEMQAIGKSPPGQVLFESVFERYVREANIKFAKLAASAEQEPLLKET